MKKNLFFAIAFIFGLATLVAATRKENPITKTNKENIVSKTHKGKKDPGCCYEFYQTNLIFAHDDLDLCGVGCNGDSACIVQCNLQYIEDLGQAEQKYEDCINNPTSPCWGE